MSRLNEVMDNHDNLNDLLSVLKHYAVSAEFVSYALIEQFKQKEEDDKEDENAENDQQYTAELIEDLNQFHARF
jgi:hypothetical protein